MRECHKVVNQVLEQRAEHLTRAYPSEFKSRPADSKIFLKSTTGLPVVMIPVDGIKVRLRLKLDSNANRSLLQPLPMSPLRKVRKRSPRKKKNPRRALWKSVRRNRRRSQFEKRKRVERKMGNQLPKIRLAQRGEKRLQ